MEKRGATIGETNSGTLLDALLSRGTSFNILKSDALTTPIIVLRSIRPTSDHPTPVKI
jgi:hypothetical protein